ncbi:putative signal transduction histidine kinase [Emticicia oligotrophica DSM 17448]|uniref:Signal transduction histidine kinase n=1 Tax=Emticicia oligotrophica (strain DSM 17448 / CIP 109782 / MTCC 6937 / GPTSA100-15) TaxID=929562 RepID=A0ABN4AQK2_EMTOG|nr:histidine kinase [Emticicia oligotrophica]AFK04699.1 putative signal transduction histidine kinase [Emticicia oligotrophica DSM 17448]
MQNLNQRSLLQTNRILLLHLSFWALYYSFFFYQITFSRHGEEPNYLRAFYDATSQIFFMALISYFNYFICLPRFLKYKNLGRYVIEFIIPFAIIIICHIYLKRYIYLEIKEAKGFLYSSKFIIQHAIGAIFIAIFIGMLRFVKDWFELETKKNEIENEKLTAELRFLKAQVNPHFLFNTLNNLYYLAMINSPNTTEVIEKLSQMMRYMLYDSNYPKVSLAKEIEYMKNYISLEKLRLDNQVPINFEIAGNPDEVQIVPLIFITFLENAFKHGVSNSSTNAYVNISINIEGQECIYSVENSKLPANLETTNEKSGIGLQNVSRRLDLSYPNKYDLEVNEDEKNYKIVLKLNLA